jgi:hypothetical protein
MKIKKAAIQYGSKVWTGKRHADVIKLIIKSGQIFSSKYEQGFVTITDQFVTRQEAYRIALGAKQIAPKRLKLLLSEDLY